MKIIYYFSFLIILLISVFLLLWGLQFKAEIQKLQAQLEVCNILNESNEIIFENCDKEKTSKLLLIISYLEDEIVMLNDSISMYNPELKSNLRIYYEEFKSNRDNKKLDSL